MTDMTQNPSPITEMPVGDEDLADIISEAVSDHNEMGEVYWPGVARDVRAALASLPNGGDSGSEASEAVTEELVQHIADCTGPDSWWVQELTKHWGHSETTLDTRRAAKAALRFVEEIRLLAQSQPAPSANPASNPNGAGQGEGERLAELSAKATQGEWFSRGNWIADHSEHGRHSKVIVGKDCCYSPGDCDFIANLVNAYRSGQLIPAPSPDSGSATAAREMGGEVDVDLTREFDRFRDRLGEITSEEFEFSRQGMKLLMEAVDRMESDVLAALRSPSDLLVKSETASVGGRDAE